MSRLHWVALTTRARIGGKTITRLLTHFGNLPAIFNATTDELQAVSGIGVKTANAIAAIDLAQVEADLRGWDQQGIQTITWEDAAYPANLLRSDDAPPVLFVRGSLNEADQRAVAIVGTRQASKVFLELAYQMGLELARRGWTIVSGLALGIDTAAHRGALDAGGRTLAVLGCGVGAIYPEANASVAIEIIQHGALLSELQPMATVSRQTLIARNRITSALSRAVNVVQTELKGGSMSTAHRALSQGRGLYAVEGGGEGCRDLISRGAIPLTAGSIDWDVLSTQLDSTLSM